MANNINIDLNNPNGVTLATENKFCDKNIYVAPLLQSKTITSNGDIVADTGYVGLLKVTVNVPAIPTQEKSVTITENGTTEVTPDSGKNLSKVTVTTNVAGITEITTSSAMDTVLVAANVGKYYKYVGTTDDKYTNGDIYQVQDEE